MTPLCRCERAPTLVVLALHLACAAETRWLVNGDFDRETAAWAAAPATPEAVRFEDYDYMSPRYVLRLEHGGTKGTSVVSQSVSGLYADSVFTLSCWLKPGVTGAGDGGGARVRVLAGTGTGGAALAASPVLSRTGPWRSVDLVFNSGTHRTVTVVLELAEAAGTARFDDVRLVRGDSTGGHDQTPADPRLKNLARGKPYALTPKPSYSLCTDPGDGTDLTDGVRTLGHYWVQKSTVGWKHPRGPTAITVDLGSRQPVRGAAFGSAGGSAGDPGGPRRRSAARSAWSG